MPNFKMKVLIITYYWPPSGGSGVQRWLKFVKYLPSCGITPYVFTPENPSFDLRDESLLKDIPNETEVIRFPIWEPYQLGQKIFGKPSNSSAKSDSSKSGFIKNVMTWGRGNLLFPDPRIFWVKPSVQFLEGWLKDNDINTIITTGPPHSIHLIGLRLKKKNPQIKWVADFRDPWSEWGILLSFKLSFWAKWIHRRMEKQVLTTADNVITITPFYVKQLQRLSGRKVDLITNGFDEPDFVDLNIQPTHKFIIRHVGLVNPSCDPMPFMLAVKDLIKGKPDLGNQIEINFTGNVNSDFRELVLQDDDLSKITTFRESVSHRELIKLYNSSSALLLVLTGYKDGEGFLPGKLFEYLATSLPIIAVGPVPSDANDLLLGLNKAQMIESSDAEMIMHQVLSMFDDWKKGHIHKKQIELSNYSRKQLTFKLVEMLKSL